MIRLLMMRHGPTAWNAAGRIQGRADPPLSEEGAAAVAGWRLETEWTGWRWHTSPLRRCAETARLLGAVATPEPALAEMDWGDWEGERLPDLRERLGTAMAENEARGLDFRPTGGESPREVQDRLRPWLAAVAAEGAETVAVTHRGVIRAVYAMAIDWDMRHSAPVRIARHGAAQLFALDDDGTPSVARLNISLEPDL